MVVLRVGGTPTEALIRNTSRLFRPTQLRANLENVRCIINTLVSSLKSGNHLVSTLSILSHGLFFSIRCCLNDFAEDRRFFPPITWIWYPLILFKAFVRWKGKTKPPPSTQFSCGVNEAWNVKFFRRYSRHGQFLNIMRQFDQEWIKGQFDNS